MNPKIVSVSSQFSTSIDEVWKKLQRLYDTNHFTEGAGIMPDLWVSGDALEAALVLAKKQSDLG